MRQGEEYVPGTGALNVQLSAEETYAGTLSPPASLHICCTWFFHAAQDLRGRLTDVDPALRMHASPPVHSADIIFDAELTAVVSAPQMPTPCR